MEAWQPARAAESSDASLSDMDAFDIEAGSRLTAPAQAAGAALGPGSEDQSLDEGRWMTMQQGAGRRRAPRVRPAAHPAASCRLRTHGVGGGPRCSPSRVLLPNLLHRFAWLPPLRRPRRAAAFKPAGARGKQAAGIVPAERAL
jgi:hypothetical protein